MLDGRAWNGRHVGGPAEPCLALLAATAAGREPTLSAGAVKPDPCRERIRFTATEYAGDAIADRQQQVKQRRGQGDPCLDPGTKLLVTRWR